MTTLYGIPNCDTVKKARAWLSQYGIDYVFHDFRKQGVPEPELDQWLAHVGWERLVNRKGTTQRPEDCVLISSAAPMMPASPSEVIQRRGVASQ